MPVIIIGVNGSNCYSMEDTNEIPNDVPQNDRIIRYLSNGPSNDGATWEQWTKRANFEPIDAYAEKYDNFHTFCEYSNLTQLREGIRVFLIDIYKLAHILINSDDYDFYSITNSVKAWTNQRTGNNVNEQNIYSILFPIEHLNKQNTHTAFFPLKKIKSSIRTAQKKLNPNKYNNDIDDIMLEPNTEFKLMKGCYYFANQLVQLTHDIVYAINNKVTQYKELSKTKHLSNEQIYEDFRKYLIEEITAPCYKALVEAFAYIIDNNNDSLIINNLTLNPNDDEIKYNFFNHLSFECDVKQLKYNLVCNFSSLGTELSKKSKEFIDTLNNNVKIINKNMQGNISNQHIKDDLYILNNLPIVGKEITYDYHYIDHVLKYVMKYSPLIIEDIDSENIITNDEVINDANNCLQDMQYNATKIIRFVHNLYFYRNVSSKQGVPEYNKYDDNIENLENILDNFNMQIPNKNYLSEIKELLQKY